MIELRLAVVRDFRAEGWPSMDLCADQLLAHLPHEVVARDVAPEFLHLFSRLPLGRRLGFNADRLVNRRLLLPRAVRRCAGRSDFVHVVDHSYAHIVNAVPRGRAGVYCHDLDAFRCLHEPRKDPRPLWFRRLAGRTLDGLRRAAVVFHSTVAVGRDLLANGLVSPERLVHAPYGTAAEFSPEPAGACELPVPVASPFLLHVGSSLPRKRLDVLLDVFAVVRERTPGLRLVQVGGPWPPHLAAQISRLGLGPSITQMRNLYRDQLAELYRRASVVLVPSEAEGFGLPVIEALACGASVIASDIPTLREAGGDAVSFAAVADVPAWAAAVTAVLNGSPEVPARETRLAHAARFSWHTHARIVADAYFRLRDRS